MQTNIPPVPQLNKQAVHSVEISAIAHATDDLDKVQRSLTTILPDSLKEQQLFTRRYLEGHHRNPIVTFEARLTRPVDVEDFASNFFRQLSKNQKLRIARDLALHSDADGNLFIRIDKQKAFRGILELGEEDPIRVRLKFNRLTGPPAELMKKTLESD